MTTSPPGWYLDQTQMRYWDGTQWTEHTHATEKVPEKISVGGVVLALLLPMIGFIGGLISLIVGPQRKTGAVMVGISIVSFCVYSVLLSGLRAR